MEIPWNDWVIAIGYGGTDEIVAEGTLRTVVTTLAAKPRDEQLKIVLSFPDRRMPPHEMAGEQIATLAELLGASWQT